MFFAPSESEERHQIWNKGVPNTSDNIKIKIKIPNPNQEPPASSKAPTGDLKTQMFFAPSKSRKKEKIESMLVSKTSDHILIKIKMPNSSQEF